MNLIYLVKYNVGGGRMQMVGIRAFNPEDAKRMFFTLIDEDVKPVTTIIGVEKVYVI
jgi:hypothetical protein